MSRKDITKHLSALLEKHLNPSNDTRIYISKEVSFNCYGGEQTIRVDYMRFKPVNNYTAEGIENGKFYCYEIKSSVEDFHSPNGHNFIGDYNYYVMPEEVFEKVKDEIPSNVGVANNLYKLGISARELTKIGVTSPYETPFSTFTLIRISKHFHLGLESIVTGKMLA